MCIITHLSVNDKGIEYENLKNCKQEAMTTDMKIFMGKKVRPLMVFLLVFCAVVTCSCRKSGSENKKIEIRVTERVTKDNTKVQIPEFISENEEVSRNIKDLNKKCMNLQKIAEKEEEKGSHMEMLSYVDYVKGYPQVTVMWYILDDTTRIYNIMTLGADEKNSLPITSKEALEMTGMSGVDLSLKVGKLSKDSGIRGELLSTEMQGFRIDEEGKVKEIYMKLIMEIKKENETVEEEHFFSYIPEEEKLEKLSLRGYEVP